MTLPINTASLELIMTGILLAGGIVYAVAQAWNGRSQRKTDEESDATLTIRLVKEAREALEQKLKDQNLVIIQQGKDIAALQTQLKSERDLNERYLQLLQNRNPELEIFMKNMSVSMEVLVKGVESLLHGQEKILTKPTVAITNQTQPAQTPA